MKLSENRVDIYSGCSTDHLLKGACRIDTAAIPHIIAITPDSNSCLFTKTKSVKGIWEEKAGKVSMIFSENGEEMPNISQSDSVIIITGVLPDQTKKLPNYPTPEGPGLPVTNWLLGGVSIYPIYKWLPVEDADTYAIQVAEDINFNSLIVNACGLKKNRYQIKVKQLRLDFVYYWRVSATNQSGTSPWSPIIHFKTTFD